MTANKGARLLPPLAAIMVAAGTGITFHRPGEGQEPKTVEDIINKCVFTVWSHVWTDYLYLNGLLLGCFDEKGNGFFSCEVSVAMLCSQPEHGD